MTTYQTPDCVCNSKEPHFCPPGFGDPGFYACKAEDVIAEVRRLRFEVERLSGVRCVWCCQLEIDCERDDTCVKGLGGG